MFVLCLLPVVELGLVRLKFYKVELAVTQHSHCEYWLNAFAHILGVELRKAETTSTSTNIRTTRSESFALFVSSDSFLDAFLRILIIQLQVDF